VSNTESMHDSQPLRTIGDVPQMPLLDMLKAVVGNGRGRIDMRSGLAKLRADAGDVAIQGRWPLRMVNLFGPDANRLVLMDRDRVFSSRKPWMMIMGKIFPNGLLLFDGEEHKHQRKIMHGTFKRPILRDYAQRMNPMIRAGVEDWRQEGEAFLAFPAFKQLTLDIATSIFIGTELDEGSRRMNKAFEDMVAASMSRIRLPIPGLEFHRGLLGREYMLQYLGDMIPKKRANDGHDMFSALCHAETEMGESCSDREIHDHMILHIVGAHDTTTSSLC
jgi:cytochrome P450